ncbi:hypothetical protein ACFVZ3_32975 [Kitasatospora purpeofusca]|uniref:hypothetical protein n=1 Tax=Kitasatospora purpeofusca TaxID=67352 RepID=UPI0036ADA571
MQRAHDTGIPLLDPTWFRVHRVVELHQVLVPACTPHPATHRFLDRDDLRVRTASQVRQGDLILAVFQAAAPGRALAPADHYYNNGPYPADPKPFDPSCGCEACGTHTPANAVVITSGWPWNVCDVHPGDAPLLVLPYGGQPSTFSELKHLTRGGTLRIDTGYDSFQQYLTTGSYMIIMEPPTT